MPQKIYVTESSKNIKAIARQALSGNWGAAILATLLNYAIVSLPSLVASFLTENDNIITALACYSYIVIGPATLGLTMFFIKLFRQEPHQARLVLSGFNFFGKALSTYFNIMIKVFLWSLLFVIPGLIASIRFSMSFFILTDHPDYSPIQCMNESSRIMNGNKDRFFRLLLSFALWYIILELPKCAIELKLTGILGADAGFTEIFRGIVDTVLLEASSWQAFIAGALTIFVQIYINVSECCFYDLLTGRLVVKRAGDDNSAANESVMDYVNSEPESFVSRQISEDDEASADDRTSDNGEE